MSALATGSCKWGVKPVSSLSFSNSNNSVSQEYVVNRIKDKIPIERCRYLRLGIMIKFSIADKI